jgi:hypothetical protein
MTGTPIPLRLLTYGEESYPDFLGDVMVFEPNSLYVTQPVPLLHQHDRVLVAAGLLSDLAVDDDGAVLAQAQLLEDGNAAQDAVTELTAGLRTDISVGVCLDELEIEELDPLPGNFWNQWRVHVQSAELVESSRVWRGRMPSAQILANPYQEAP